MSELVHIFCIIVMLMFFSTVLCGLGTTEGTKSNWLVYRALYLELWLGAGASENDVPEEKVSE